MRSRSHLLPALARINCASGKLFCEHKHLDPRKLVLALIFLDLDAEQLAIHNKRLRSL